MSVDLPAAKATTLQRLKIIQAKLQTLHNSVETRIKTLDVKDKEAAHPFKVRLGICLEKKPTPKLKESIESLVADCIKTLSELSLMWHMNDYESVVFPDERWHFKATDTNAKTIILGVESAYSFFAIRTAAATDKDGVVLVAIVATFLPQAVYKGKLFCERIIEQLEASPF